jgi:hypothetical protein
MIDNSQKIILSLCSGTGAWERPYVEAGYDVRSITLPEYDVRMYQPPENVYGILAAPPCTCFCSAGARWIRSKEQMLEAISIVDACIRLAYVCKPKFWALENPIGKLKRILGCPALMFNPCDFGDPWTKKTLLWGNFNIPVKNPVEAKEFLPHKILSSKVSQNQINKLIDVKYLPENYKEIYGDLRDRAVIRAITPPGFAQAFMEANR